MSERDLTDDDVREEHLRDVDQRRQWAYLVVVLVGGILAMIGLIAVLGAMA